jgi:shikimate kinase
MTLIIALCGFMGSGKSYFVKKLEQNSNEGKFLDLDDVVYFKNQTGEKDLAELIEKRGWSYFREKEFRSLKELLQKREYWDETLVLSLGGGTLSDRSLDLFTSIENTVLIWLESSFEKCFERILDEGSEKRPLLKKGKEYIHKLYLERNSLYSRSALTISEDQRKSIGSISDFLGFINKGVENEKGRSGKISQDAR